MESSCGVLCQLLAHIDTVNGSCHLLMEDYQTLGGEGLSGHRDTGQLVLIHEECITNDWALRYIA